MADKNHQRHWDAAYAEGDEHRSWTQDRPRASLSAIHSVLRSLEAPIIDVGGGSSPLAAELVAAGYTDVTVLDLSPAALQLAQQRLGDRAEGVIWLAADLLDWEPPRRYELWHDRATLHFFVDRAARERYADVARAAIAPGGYAVIATFAPDGPTQCSGLPVRRSSADEIASMLGAGFSLVSSDSELHRTPGGAVQPFTWAILRRDEP